MLCDQLQAMLDAHARAHEALQPLVAEYDLERYYDMYEITQPQIDQVKQGFEELMAEDPESLKGLKGMFLWLFLTRKMILCCLLALDADGGKPDFARWTAAVGEMSSLESTTSISLARLDRILSEEGRKIPPEARQQHATGISGKH